MDKLTTRVLNLQVPETRRYQETHPWIKFEYLPLVKRIDAATWLNLGESFSKCSHLLGAPIPPNTAEELAQIYMRRGAWATTQIEGNTLSEKQLDEILDEKGVLPESQQYSAQEIKNVISALGEIEKQIAQANIDDPAHNSNFKVTPEWIKAINSQLLQGLELEDHVAPGEYRNVSVGVMNYRAAPQEDIEFLMNKFCEWINTLIKGANEQGRSHDPIQGFAATFIIAVLAHLYFAWIHPFGDGNGRTARLIECALLANSNLVPWISTNILSDYYNKTRDLYYKRLEGASANSDVMEFLKYSVQGFREQIKNQVAAVQIFQRDIAWRSFVDETFASEMSTEKTKRQKDLVLNLSENELLSVSGLLLKNLYVKTFYSSKSPRTLRRDLDDLVSKGLVEEVSSSLYRANTRVMDGFKPLPELGSH